MFRIYIIQTVLNFFDFFQQKKIFNFLKNEIKKDPILFDVGAHHGETIKNFYKYFNYKEIHCFEASIQNFNILKKNQKTSQNNIYLNNFGLSDENKDLKLNQSAESSSSTLSKINKNSKYFKKKIKILGLSDKNYSSESIVKLKRLDDYFRENDISEIDLLKIDTEGHEYYVLKGSSKILPKIRYIYFEHHYDDMIEKGYTFSVIDGFLKQNNFKKIFKSKMFFRKTFEYIYKNLD
jgi:FkbM family methyltransferase|tara:strand:+ start:99 stop:806 length:708 start_codon:yes stop_codon:yes gene_type:complete